MLFRSKKFCQKRTSFCRMTRIHKKQSNPITQKYKPVVSILAHKKFEDRTYIQKPVIWFRSFELQKIGQASRGISDPKMRLKKTLILKAIRKFERKNIWEVWRTLENLLSFFAQSFQSPKALNYLTPFEYAPKRFYQQLKQSDGCKRLVQTTASLEEKLTKELNIWHPC